MSDKNIQSAIAAIHRAGISGIGVDYSKGKDETAVCLTGAVAKAALLALEKQVVTPPQQVPRVWPDGRDYIRLDCPTCGEETTQDHCYCDECGQKLKEDRP